MLRWHVAIVWPVLNRSRVSRFACILVCFLVEFDLLFAFSVLSLDCASLCIYVHEHDRLCFPMSSEETAVLIAFVDLVPVATEKVSLIRWNTVWNQWKSILSAQSIRVNLNHRKEM